MAFNALVERYQGLIYNVTYRIIGDPDMADDATQDTMIRAYKRLHQYRGGSFKAWLARVGTNCAYDRLRAKKRRRTSSLDELQEQNDRHSSLINGRQSPEDHAIAVELSAAIDKALQAVPSEQRSVMVLIDLNGFNYQEASEALDISLGTVKSRLSRARAKVREALQNNPELLPRDFRL